MSSHIKRILSHKMTLIIALIVFLSWIGLQFYVYNSIDCPTQGSCTLTVPLIGEVPKSLVESYLASSFDSFIFFLFIGAIALLISLKTPEEEDLLKKINYIFPDTKSDPELLRFIKGRIASVACVVTESKRYLDLQDVSECKKFIKLSIKSESQLTNIYHNHDFISNEMTFSMKVKPVPDKEIWGEVTEASLTSSTKYLPKDHNNLRANKKLTKEMPEYKKRLSIKLKPSQGAIYRTSAWCWQSYQDTFRFNVNRFTKVQYYTVRNTSNAEISVTVESEKLVVGVAEKIFNYVRQYLDKEEVSSVNIETVLDKETIEKDLSEQKKAKKTFSLPPNSKIKFECVNVTPDDIVMIDIGVNQPSR